MTLSRQLASDLGFLGVNVDSAVELSWLKTEVADKIREGDKTSILRLVNLARHSEDEKVKAYAVTLTQIYERMLEAYPDDPTGEKEETSYEEAESVEEITNIIDEAIASGEDAHIEIKSDMDLTDGNKSITIPEGANVELKVDSTVTCSKNSFNVNNGTLTLSGEGTIVSDHKAASGVIVLDGADSVLNLEGVTIDTVSKHEGESDNYAYGVYSKNGATVNFKSGTIKVAGGSCISTNNTTGGCDINISGGELLSDGSYAVYVPAQGNVHITGGRVQGINARMGNIVIEGDAVILPTTITAETCDPIGSNITASGSIWVGDTIAILAGTYTDPNGVDTTLEIKGNATVSSNFRSAIGIYSLDTKQKSNVVVNVQNASAVSTTDGDSEAIFVYDHDYLSNAASEAGKTYNPSVTSDITVTVAGQQIYPAA